MQQSDCPRRLISDATAQLREQEAAAKFNLGHFDMAEPFNAGSTQAASARSALPWRLINTWGTSSEPTNETRRCAVAGRLAAFGWLLSDEATLSEPLGRPRVRTHIYKAE
ncbi:uncharacterized protein MYCFIDRAFT_171544 [Pseudocercospora fijiensis CIRAD86]|uniref:Uncharacterized protein n=1 Tax=Pseudocercospora fijiensis (strain CIRAD86) TaxID=383855 RepID=M2Z792_PSEFD|nr:uncharacterized protein MYCFIDRAFT_171544 [Pseudocercospora fijiensis CIRAD86]EME85655.1 hypothetical protein MYCFIDRAFT_171544 [Pseudocercospora fijiensis CIRAD86]